MGPEEKAIQKKEGSHFSIRDIRKIRAVKPESERRPHGISARARMVCTALSALLTFSQFYPAMAEAKGKREKEPAAEVNAVDEWIAAEKGEAPKESLPAESAAPAEEKGGQAGIPNEAANIQKEKKNQETLESAASPPPSQQEEKEGVLVTHNIVFPALPKRLSGYADPALSQFFDSVDMRGRPRGIRLDNPIDIGATVVGNEAGNSVAGNFRYRDLARLDTGMIAWFGDEMVPFGRVGISPYVNIWNFKIGYYGTAAFIANMPSWVYSSHSAGLGYSQPIGDNFRLRMGGIIGGALSYPTWDDTYFNLSAGLSMEIWKMFLLYGNPTFYFAAEDPIKTAYVGYYRPRFQDLEVGAQVALDEYTIRLFANIGLIGDDYGIYNKYGFRGTRTFAVEQSMEMDLWLSLGMTQWSGQISGRIDPLVMVGATLVVGGETINSSNALRYSHVQDMTWEQAKTDIPNSKHPGPYGFGHSGDPYYDVPINETKERILNSATFEEFKNGYGGALSEDEVIVRARFLGAFLQKVAYANNAYDSMVNGNIFDGEIQRIASADEELIFQYLKSYVKWYSEHGSNAPLPPELQNGIAVCAGIHWIMAEFMRANGVKSIVRQVNTPDGMHVIAIADLKGRAVLLDYGKMLEASDIDHATYLYGQMNGSPTFQSQTFGEKGYIGTEVTPAGRLLHDAVGLDNPEILKKDYLGVR